MQSYISPETLDLGFLQTYTVADELFALPSGDQISIPKYFLEFKSWQGEPILNTYNGKAVIDWNGEPVFAELAVLRLFESNGWEGVWVDSYRRKYRTGLPDITEPIAIPDDKRILLDTLRERTGRYGGCWDLLVWKGDALLFLELKLVKKDAIRESQIVWLDESLKHGLNTKNFAFIEWKVN